jgi:hypothetical protein
MVNAIYSVGPYQRSAVDVKPFDTVLPNILKVCCFIVRLVASLGPILLDGWPRHTRKCVPITRIYPNMIAAPAPVQTQMITGSAILCASQEDTPGLLASVCT